MKRIIVTGAVAALATVSFAGTASAFEPGTPQCFGQGLFPVTRTPGFWVQVLEKVEQAFFRCAQGRVEFRVIQQPQPLNHLGSQHA